MSVQSIAEPAHAGLARRWATTAVACSGLLLIGIDGTVLNVAIPAMQRALHPSTAEVQWTVDAFAVVMAGTVLAAGSLGDRVGRRRVFITGLLLCAAASAAGGAATSPGQMIGSRVVQGAGCALMMPATLSIIIDVFPEPHLRRRGIAVWAAVAGVGGLLGPVAGGWLVDHASWRAAFWSSMPVALLAAGLAAWLVPESRDADASPLDHRGALLSTAGLGTLVWAVVAGPKHGWTSPSVLAAFAGAALLLTAFAVWQARCRAPMLPLALLSAPRVRLGLAMMALISALVFGSVLILNLYMQGVLDYSALRSGTRTLPATAGMVVGAALALPLLNKLGRFGDRTAILAGLTILAAAFALLATFTTAADYRALAVYLVLLGTGAGVILAAATEMVMAAFPGERAGLGSALNDVTRQVGLALGIAVQGSALSAIAARRLHGPGDDVNALLAAAHVPGGPGPAAVAAAKDAFVHGMTRCALAGAVLVGAVAVPVAWSTARTLTRSREARRARP
ncbi:MFS transporter [Actinomadura rayongensis]|uniref:MFS transporter n=1 Tax=Actinomadura rayongensis TaxID=1429076 RepID=A0A6I4WNY6_9ACTN|nr:MFS transporter [Actinomadura rayongensis]MXQ68312.1 MFS transporter [Actinomadura rayongensis]